MSLHEVSDQLNRLSNAEREAVLRQFNKPSLKPLAPLEIIEAATLQSNEDVSYTYTAQRIRAIPTTRVKADPSMPTLTEDEKAILSKAINYDNLPPLPEVSADEAYVAPGNKRKANEHKYELEAVQELYGNPMILQSQVAKWRLRNAPIMRIVRAMAKQKKIKVASQNAGVGSQGEVLVQKLRHRASAVQKTYNDLMAEFRLKTDPLKAEITELNSYLAKMNGRVDPLTDLDRRRVEEILSGSGGALSGVVQDTPSTQTAQAARNIRAEQSERLLESVAQEKPEKAQFIQAITAINDKATGKSLSPQKKRKNRWDVTREDILKQIPEEDKQAPAPKKPKFESLHADLNYEAPGVEARQLEYNSSKPADMIEQIINEVHRDHPGVFDAAGTIGDFAHTALKALMDGSMSRTTFDKRIEFLTRNENTITQDPELEPNETAEQWRIRNTRNIMRRNANTRPRPAQPRQREEQIFDEEEEEIFGGEPSTQTLPLSTDRFNMPPPEEVPPHVPMETQD